MTGNSPCYYKLKVDSIDNPTTGHITASYASDQYSAPDDISKDKFKFRVRDLDKVNLKVGDVRMFSNGIGEPALEVFDAGADFPEETQKPRPIQGWLRVLVP
jgi:hypothetical protein